MLINAHPFLCTGYLASGSRWGSIHPALQPERSAWSCSGWREHECAGASGFPDLLRHRHRRRCGIVYSFRSYLAVTCLLAGQPELMSSGCRLATHLGRAARIRQCSRHSFLLEFTLRELPLTAVVSLSEFMSSVQRLQSWSSQLAMGGAPTVHYTSALRVRAAPSQP